MNFLKKHLSLVVMAIGAGSQFLGSVFLYKILDPTVYGSYALLITYLSIVFSFGLLGSEQTFLRVSSINQNKVLISKSLLMVLLISLIFGPIILAISATLTFMPGFKFANLFFVGLLAAIVMFSYNYYRILSQFVESQIVNNFWRLGVLASLIWAWIYGIDFNLITIFIVGALIITSIFFIGSLFYRNTYPLITKEDTHSNIRLTLSFLFSMGVLTALSFFDRYLIGAKFDLATFGEFFFLQNVFVYPFVLLANYVGFKELVAYKKNFDLTLFNKRMVIMLIAVPLLAILYTLIVIFIDSYFALSLDFLTSWDLIIPLVIFGCIKLLYASLSAAMGAKGRATDLLVANSISLLILILACLILINLDVSIATIAWTMSLLWATRSLLYYFGVKKCAHEV